MTRQDPPDWLLERYRLGEVSQEQRARVDAALQADPTVQARLDALSADDQQVLAAHPTARVMASIRSRAGADDAVAEPLGARSRRWLLPVLAATAAVLVAVVLTRPERDDITLKGLGAQLTLYRLTPQGAAPLLDHGKVRPGDVVQARVRLDAPGYAVLLSFDALGQVSVHTPLKGSDTATDAGLFATARSFELDATPGFERFLLVTSERPLSLAEVTDAARALSKTPQAQTAALPLEGPAEQRSLLLLKETP
jgi:hypothetical protein